MLQNWKIASERKSETACNRRICRSAVGCSPNINFSFASESSKYTRIFLYGMFFNAMLFSLALMTSVFSAFMSVLRGFYHLTFFSLSVLEKKKQVFVYDSFLLLCEKSVDFIAVNYSRSACFRCYQLICFHFS